MTNLFDLTGKVAVVTGASSGLGIQMAKALARNGASVAIVARRQEQLETVRGEVEALGAVCKAYVCDVTQNDQIEKTVAAIEADFKKIDILCNNAGIGWGEPADKQADKTWNTVINTNLNAPYFFARAVAQGMIQRGYGKIIMTGSIHSSVAIPELPLSAYCASKSGIVGLTKALATEWAKYGITVNAIGPAYFPSAMTSKLLTKDFFLETIKERCPMGRPGREGELDGAVVYFASDASSYTTGQLLSVDGGWTAI
jgi:gluconate 5-dehydrogenase